MSDEAQAVISRLCWHAGLASDVVEPEPCSPLVGALPRWGASAETFAAAKADYLSSLQDLSSILNGPFPSSSTSGKASSVDRRAAYAQAEIVCALQNESKATTGSPEGMVQALWEVTTAWAAVLAGDIDDIAEHLAGEEWAR